MAKKVLIVEDEPNIAMALAFLLEQEGFSVAVIGDGRRALESLAVEQPDVLVLDAMLPEVDGYEVLRTLRERPRTAKLPIIMLTAKGQPQDRAAAIEGGADRFMTKPFANADLVAVVRELAERV